MQDMDGRMKNNIETLLKRYNIEYEYGDEQEVAEGLKFFDEALLSIGYDINDTEDEDQ